jgi:hypothetical protein
MTEKQDIDQEYRGTKAAVAAVMVVFVLLSWLFE